MINFWSQTKEKYFFCFLTFVLFYGGIFAELIVSIMACGLPLWFQTTLIGDLSVNFCPAI